MIRIHGVAHAHRDGAQLRNRFFLDNVDIPSLRLVCWCKEVLEHKGQDKGLSMEAYSHLLGACIHISLSTQIFIVITS